MTGRSERPERGPRDLGRRVAVGDVVQRAARPAHRHRADREEQQQRRVGPALPRRARCPTSRGQQQPGPDRPVQPRQPGIRPPRRAGQAPDPVAGDECRSGRDSCGVHPCGFSPSPPPGGREGSVIGGCHSCVNLGPRRPGRTQASRRRGDRRPDLSDRPGDPPLFCRNRSPRVSPVALDMAQAHRLRHVLRLGSGAAVAGFNEREGEWLCRLAEVGPPCRGAGARATIAAPPAPGG